MLKELRHFENFGTPNYFYQLLCTLNNNPNTGWKLSDLRQMFYNQIIDGKSIFDGCIPLALKINILIEKKKKFYIANEISGFLNSNQQMCDKFLEFLFLALKDDDDFHNIFCSKHLSHDIIYRSLQIKKSAFGFKFANFKNLLIDFGAIKNHPTHNISNFIINTRFKKLFDKTVLPEIKKRKVGIEEFRKSLEQKQIYGEEAEKFVLSYEEARLCGKQVDWVAEYVVNEGYDIASFNNENDISFNRFIEVKSYAGENPYFFWSRNEIRAAKIKQGNYWIYLVNRDEIKNTDYVPIQVQNPYINLLKDENWNKQIEKYRIEYQNTND